MHKLVSEALDLTDKVKRQVAKIKADTNDREKRLLTTYLKDQFGKMCELGAADAKLSYYLLDPVEPQ